MMATTTIQRTPAEISDEQVVERVLAGDIACFEILMRRYNQRLYRVALAITRNDGEAEDIMQETYVRAYQHLRQFAGRAKFSTWLTRIAVHGSLARNRQRGRFEHSPASPEPEGDIMDTFPSGTADPEQRVSQGEAGRLLEEAVNSLPDPYRTIFVLRDVEELNTNEAAEVLGISEENVKTRLHRARALLRRELFVRAGAVSSSAFQFHALRCDRVVKNVLARIVGM
jgi:RNA polymerase sigma-70 factor (ECF subfamily)